MALRILQVILLLVISSEAVAQQPLPPRPPQPPPLAPPASTQLGAADRREVLIAAAAHMREAANHARSLAGGDSIVLDPRLHNSQELELLQSELRAGTGTLDSLRTNCALFGCDLIVPQYVAFGQPVLRADETVTIDVEHVYRGGRYPSGNVRPVVSTRFELVLGRTGGAWTVTAIHTRYIT